VEFPAPERSKLLISYIPFIGIQHAFQGEPRDAARDDKFAYQILDDLIEYAAEKTAGRTDLYPAIGLSVDGDNKRAIRFYENRGFVNANTPRKDKRTGVVYERMFLNIASLVATPQPPAGGQPSPPRTDQVVPQDPDGQPGPA
jgi:hypothetical protein